MYMFIYINTYMYIYMWASLLLVVSLFAERREIVVGGKIQKHLLWVPGPLWAGPLWAGPLWAGPVWFPPGIQDAPNKEWLFLFAFYCRRVAKVDFDRAVEKSFNK